MPENLCSVLSQPFYVDGSQEVIEEQALRILREHPEQKNSATVSGVKAIHLAALNGHLRVLQELARLSVSINETHRGNGLSVAHFAALGGRWDIMLELQRLEANLDVVDVDGSNILDIAIDAFIQEEKPEQLEFIANLINVTKMKPSTATGPDKLLNVCILACKFDNADALKSIYTCGVEIPYAINQITGFHILIEMSLRSLSPNCLTLLHGEFKLPMRASEVTETKDTTVKSDPYELIFNSLPPSELLITPTIFLSQFKMGAYESPIEAKERAYNIAREIFAKFSLTPNARLRYDSDEQIFYIERLFLGGANFIFNVHGNLTNIEELKERLFATIGHLNKDDFSYCDETGKRCGKYQNLFHSHPDLVKDIVTNGFKLTLDDLHYAIDNCYSEMVIYLLDELAPKLAPEELIETRKKLISSENDKILSDRADILSYIDKNIKDSLVAAEEHTGSIRPSSNELHAAFAVEAIMLSRRSSPRIAEGLEDEGAEREVVVEDSTRVSDTIKPNIT